MLSIATKDAICAYKIKAAAYADAINAAERNGGQPDTRVFDAMMMAAQQVEDLCGFTLVFALHVFQKELN